MASSSTHVKVFVASPSDVGKERNKLDKIIHEINLSVAHEKNLHLELVRWETHTWPGFGKDAQSVIDDQIGPYDIFIGIMWNKFGTPTADAPSGTVKEFENAYEKWTTHQRPKIMFYFCTRCFNPSDIDDLNQKKKVLDFKKKLSRHALYGEYSSLADFSTKLQRDLIYEINRWVPDESSEEISNQLGQERFCDIKHWSNLDKQGDWNISAQDKNRITGSGMFSYLLSKNIYGHTPFKIIAKLRFYDYSMLKAKNLNGSSSFIFGWNSNEKGHTYYNLVLSGEKIIFERIGFRGLFDNRDSVHIDSGRDFVIREDHTYEFVITISSEIIDVFVDGSKIYSVASPPYFIGKVGIRPWRARIECDYFEVSA